MSEANGHRKKIVIFDLDGTLALVEHRQHLVRGKKKKKWREFFAACTADTVNRPVAEMARVLREAGYQIVIFSGRSDEVRAETEKWLSENNVLYDLLVMRREGDFSPDDQLKREWLERFNKKDILCVFDDRDKVVRMWRQQGLTCFQVAPGDF
ncbi:MAG TPA: HAD family acid phosphatase [Blastocatellia bacterium]|nr:HAD family acid phosphatase [Blastocatellia bacterium]